MSDEKEFDLLGDVSVEVIGVDGRPDANQAHLITTISLNGEAAVTFVLSDLYDNAYQAYVGSELPGDFGETWSIAFNLWSHQGCYSFTRDSDIDYFIEDWSDSLKDVFGRDDYTYDDIRRLQKEADRKLDAGLRRVGELNALFFDALDEAKISEEMSVPDIFQASYDVEI